MSDELKNVIDRLVYARWEGKREGLDAAKLICEAMGDDLNKNDFDSETCLKLAAIFEKAKKALPPTP